MDNTFYQRVDLVVNEYFLDQFISKCEHKLASARKTRHGRSPWFSLDCEVAELERALKASLDDKDYVSVANYAMMIDSKTTQGY